MTKTENMVESSLKLLHEEYKLFLQIIWSGILTLTVSLLIASFTKTITIEPLITALVSMIAILGGIVITIVVFSKKFNEIREEIDKKGGSAL